MRLNQRESADYHNICEPELTGDYLLIPYAGKDRICVRLGESPNQLVTGTQLTDQLCANASQTEMRDAKSTYIK